MTTRTPNVWLLQESWSHSVDLSSAQRYGTIVPVLSGKDNPGQAPGPALFKLKHALRDYQPQDFVAYALADPAAAFLAGMVFAREDLMREPVNWLRWDRERSTDGERQRGGFYVPSLIQYK